ncbi:MAG: hypothetical protein ABUS79_00920 [Pseudomonadota bacterium]
MHDDGGSNSNSNGQGIAVRDARFADAEAEIAETRERLALSVTALEREISRAVDWREWIRRRPVASVALAFGVGWFLGRRR